MAWGGRVPTEAELTNFVQLANGSCSSQIAFPVPFSVQCVWSSTMDPQNATFYECVYFNGANPLPSSGADGNWVLCDKP
jgi:hypothetical protein